MELPNGYLLITVGTYSAILEAYDNTEDEPLLMYDIHVRYSPGADHFRIHNAQIDNFVAPTCVIDHVAAVCKRIRNYHTP